MTNQQPLESLPLSIYHQKRTKDELMKINYTLTQKKNIICYKTR